MTQFSPLDERIWKSDIVGKRGGQAFPPTAFTALCTPILREREGFGEEICVFPFFIR